MTDYRFSGLSELKLSPVEGNEALRFHLTFQSKEHHSDTIQFQLSSADSMSFLNALMGMQRKFGWPLPAYARPSGKPSLRVVVDNSEE